MVAKAYNKKNTFGYISPEFIIENDEDTKEIEDVEFKYNKIYNSMIILQNGEEIWYLKKIKLKEYFDKDKKRPSKNDPDKEIRTLTNWIGRQNISFVRKEDIMKNEKIRNEWIKFKEEYKEYLMSYKEIWMERFQALIKYIEENKKLPSRSIESEKYLELWIQTNHKNYKNKTNIHEDEEIRKIWQKFMEDYKEYFIDNSEIWIRSLEFSKNYINQYKKRPNINDTNEKVSKNATWLNTTFQNYKLNKHRMKEPEYRKIWEDFLEEYKEYIYDNKTYKQTIYEKIAKYIEKNKKKPTRTNKDEEIKKLAEFIDDKFKKIKFDDIDKEFFDKYGSYFRSYKEKWYKMFYDVIEFIKKYKKRPEKTDLNNEGKNLKYWLDDNIKNYKRKENIMKNEPKIYEEFGRFMKEYYI
tara:strand:- start:1594 stop:2823 length:1230 start_codon:yes stop_codon:yes gene_type:complete